MSCIKFETFHPEIHRMFLRNSNLSSKQVQTIAASAMNIIIRNSRGKTRTRPWQQLSPPTRSYPVLPIPDFLPIFSMATERISQKYSRTIFFYTSNQWEFQDPKIEVLYHIRPYFGGISPFFGSWNGHWSNSKNVFSVIYGGFHHQETFTIQSRNIFYTPHYFKKVPKHVLH